MRIAVDFDNEHWFAGGEVDDVGADYFLAAEFYAG